MSPEVPCLDAADANDDESIDIADPVYTLNLLHGMGPPPPPPFPECGPDPTGNGLDCELPLCTVPCQPPQNLATSTSCNSSEVSLTWTDGDGYDTIDILRDDVLIASLPGDATGHVDSGVPNGQYVYTVRGFCSGAGASSCAQASVFSIPPGTRSVMWCADGSGDVDSCQALRDAFDAVGETYLEIEDLHRVSECLIALLEDGDVIWILHGFYRGSPCLSLTEGEILAELAQAGVSIYLEGEDVVGCPTAFSNYDGVDGRFEDGYVIDDDHDSFTEMDGDIFGSLDVSGFQNIGYTQDNQSGKDWTDILIPTGTNFMPDEGGPNAGIVWRNSPDRLGETAYGVGILYEPSPPYGRVLSQSWEFGGFQGDRSDLVQRYIDALRP
jgi:hypothetical protein